MNLLQIIRSSTRLQGFLWGIRGLWGDSPEKANERYFRKKTSHIIPEYLEKYTLRKINIGSQNNPFEGWLNVDIWVGFEGVAFMDATKPFPLSDNSFDYIFSEHMIEHISLDEADFMLKECSRILKKGGKIRVATPALDNFANWIINGFPKEFEDYHQNLSSGSFKTPIPMLPDFALNYITYNYAHRFIHSRKTLKYLLERHNFKNIVEVKPRESSDPQLQNLEIHAQYMGEDLYDLETFVLEAEK